MMPDWLPTGEPAQATYAGGNHATGRQAIAENSTSFRLSSSRIAWMLHTASTGATTSLISSELNAFSFTSGSGMPLPSRSCSWDTSTMEKGNITAPPMASAMSMLPMRRVNGTNRKMNATGNNTALAVVMKSSNIPSAAYSNHAVVNPCVAICSGPKNTDAPEYWPPVNVAYITQNSAVEEYTQKPA